MATWTGGCVDDGGPTGVAVASKVAASVDPAVGAAVDVWFIDEKYGECTGLFEELALLDASQDEDATVDWCVEDEAGAEGEVVVVVVSSDVAGASEEDSGAVDGAGSPAEDW